MEPIKNSVVSFFNIFWEGCRFVGNKISEIAKKTLDLLTKKSYPPPNIRSRNVTKTIGKNVSSIPDVSTGTLKISKKPLNESGERKNNIHPKLSMPSNTQAVGQEHRTEEKKWINFTTEMNHFLLEQTKGYAESTDIISLLRRELAEKDVIPLRIWMDFTYSYCISKALNHISCSVGQAGIDNFFQALINVNKSLDLNIQKEIISSLKKLKAKHPEFIKVDLTEQNVSGESPLRERVDREYDVIYIRGSLPTQTRGQEYKTEKDKQLDFNKEINVFLLELSEETKGNDESTSILSLLKKELAKKNVIPLRKWMDYTNSICINKALNHISCSVGQDGIDNFFLALISVSKGLDLNKQKEIISSLKKLKAKHPEFIKVDLTEQNVSGESPLRNREDDFIYIRGSLPTQTKKQEYKTEKEKRFDFNIEINDFLLELSELTKGKEESTSILSLLKKELAEKEIIQLHVWEGFKPTSYCINKALNDISDSFGQKGIDNFFQTLVSINKSLEVDVQKEIMSFLKKSKANYPEFIRIDLKEGS